MLTSAALAEVVDHRFHALERPGRIGPQISPVCFRDV